MKTPRQRLQRWAFAACKYPVLSKAGRRFYRYVAAECASSWLRNSAVTRVSLRGGSVRRCVPGLSDLDFTVDLSDTAFESRKTLIDLCESYQKLKSKYWLPGEVFWFDSRDRELVRCSGTALQLLLREEVCFDEGRRAWGAPLEETLEIAPLSRFQFCLNYFNVEADRSCRNYFRDPCALTEQAFRKSLGKVLGYASGEFPLGAMAGSFAQLLARAAESLEKLAEKRGKLTDVPEPEIHFPARAPGSQETQVVTQHHLIQIESLAGKSFPVIPTYYPLTAVWSERPSFDELVSFYAAYTSWLKKFPQYRLRIFTPQVWNLYREGWEPEGTLNPLLWESTRPQESRFLKSLFLSELNRAVFGSLVSLEQLMSPSVSGFGTSGLFTMCRSGLQVALRAIVRDPLQLAESARTAAPLTSQLFLDLRQPSSWSREQLLHRAIEVKGELYPILSTLAPLLKSSALQSSHEDIS